MCWSTSAGMMTVPRTLSTLHQTPPMHQHIQVINGLNAVLEDSFAAHSISLGAKFSSKSQRSTFYGDAVMEIDWAVGQILEYVSKKIRFKSFK